MMPVVAGQQWPSYQHERDAHDQPEHGAGGQQRTSIEAMDQIGSRRWQAKGQAEAEELSRNHHCGQITTARRTQ
jgi:hypothetical protein